MQSSQRSWRSNTFQKGSGEAGVDEGHTSTMNGQLFGSRCHDGTLCPTPLFACPSCTVLPAAVSQMETAQKGPVAKGKLSWEIKCPHPHHLAAISIQIFGMLRRGEEKNQCMFRWKDRCGAGTWTGQEAALTAVCRSACLSSTSNPGRRGSSHHLLESKCLTCFMNCRRDLRFCSQYFGSSSAFGYFTQPNSMVTSKQFVFK